MRIGRGRCRALGHEHVEFDPFRGSATAPNVATISAGAGGSTVPKMPSVSVTVCAPHNNNCQTLCETR